MTGFSKIFFPLGCHFNPTNEQRVMYLQCKNRGQSREDLGIRLDIIPEIDICKHEPWEVPEIYEANSLIESKDSEWYFFSPQNRKYPNSNSHRLNRATEKGNWKVTCKDREIKSKPDPAVICIRKTLVFIDKRENIPVFNPRGASSKSVLTGWIIYEYRLPKQKGGFVLCRLFKKLEQRTSSNATVQNSILPPAPRSDSDTVGASVEPVAQADQNFGVFDFQENVQPLPQASDMQTSGENYELLPDEASNPSNPEPEVRNFNGTVLSDVAADHEFNDTTWVDYSQDYPGELVILENFDNGRDDFHVNPSVLSGTEARILPKCTYDPNGHLHDASIAVSLQQNFALAEQIFYCPDTSQRDSRCIHGDLFMNSPILNDTLAEIANSNYITQNFSPEYECPSAVRGFDDLFMNFPLNDTLAEIADSNYITQNFSPEYECPSAVRGFDDLFMNFPLNDTLAEIADSNYIRQNFSPDYECPSAVRGFDDPFMIFPLWNHDTPSIVL